jgi:hypothetical protein
MMAWCPVAMCAFGSTGPAIAAFEGVTLAPPGIALAVAVVAAVVLFGVVLEHGLGSVAVALGIVLGGAVLVGKATPWDDWGLSPGSAAVTVSCMLASAVFLASAWLAFVRGPIHLDRRVRRAVLGAGTAFAVLGAGGWAAAAMGAARADLEPGDPAVRIGTVVASPDGKYALLFVGNARVPSHCHAWAVRLEDGALTPLPGRRRSLDRWAGEGRVRLWEGRGAPGRDLNVADTIDLETGRIVSTRSPDQIDAEPWTEGWARFQRMPQGFLVEWPERRIQRRIETAWQVKAGPVPGRFVVWMNGARSKVVDLASGTERDAVGSFWMGAETWTDGGRTLCYRTGAGKLRALDCETGEDREMASLGGDIGSVSTGTFAVLHPATLRTSVVDLRDGRTVAGPWTKRCVTFIPGSDRFAITYNGTEPSTLLDCTTGRETAIEPNPNGYGYPPNLIHALPDGTFVVLRPTGGLDVIDAEARVVRTVLADGAHRVVRRSR